MRKFADKEQSKNILGIDWRIDRFENTVRLLEEKGYHKNDALKCKNIKHVIHGVLEKYKAGTKPSDTEMSTILTNIEVCDHHDLVRVDQILTRQKNENEIEYQWGSVVMNFKMKTI